MVLGGRQRGIPREFEGGIRIGAAEAHSAQCVLPVLDPHVPRVRDVWLAEDERLGQVRGGVVGFHRSDRLSADVLEVAGVAAQDIGSAARGPRWQARRNPASCREAPPSRICHRQPGQSCHSYASGTHTGRIGRVCARPQAPTQKNSSSAQAPWGWAPARPLSSARGRCWSRQPWPSQGNSSASTGCCPWQGGCTPSHPTRCPTSSSRSSTAVSLFC